MKDLILSVGGYDPTAGAGILLDSYFFTRFKVESKYVLTSIVIQTPFEVTENIVLEDRIIRSQLDALSPYYNFPLINVGLINIKLLNLFKERFKNSRIIFDPIMASGSGRHAFLSNKQIESLQNHLENIFLVTPNVPEAEKLTQKKIKNLSDMKVCAEQIRSETGALNVLLKGGHLEDEYLDLLLEENGHFTEYKAEKAGFRIHGTGSFLNAGITIGLMKKKKLTDAVVFAKENLDLAASRVSPHDPVLRL